MVLLGVFLFTAWPREAACAPIGAGMPAPACPPPWRPWRSAPAMGHGGSAAEGSQTGRGERPMRGFPLSSHPVRRRNRGVPAASGGAGPREFGWSRLNGCG